MVDSTETRVTSVSGGEKGSKERRYDLVPAYPLAEVAALYGKGAEKYADNNWRKGYDWSLSFAALNRHLWQFWNGEEFDEETGKHHLASVVFHAFALMEFGRTHPEFDNRPASVEFNGLNKSEEPDQGDLVAGSLALATDIMKEMDRKASEDLFERNKIAYREPEPRNSYNNFFTPSPDVDQPTTNHLSSFVDKDGVKKRSNKRGTVRDGEVVYSDEDVQSYHFPAGES